MRTIVLVSIIAMNILVAASAANAVFPNQINFQGVLIHGGQPVTTPTTVVHGIWNAASGGAQLWSETRMVTPDGDGSYSILLGDAGSPIPDTAFASEAWLSISVNGEDLERIRIGTVPYSSRVRTIAGAAGGHILSDVVVSGAVTVDGFTLPSGAQEGFVMTSDAYGHGTWQPAGASGYWELDGNTGTNPPANYLGTTDLVPLHLKVNGKRALRLSPSQGSSTGLWDNSSPNVAFGHSANTIADVLNGATICGGGYQDLTAGIDKKNIVTGDFGAIGGGAGNHAGSNAAIGGGLNNAATGEGAVVPGGWNNIASGARSFAAGSGCEASGSHAFALGRNAVAVHDRSFIWSSDDAARSTTQEDQFKIRADGGIHLGSTAGVCINCDDPGSFTLAVEGSIGAREVRVTAADPWPDYVFSAEYSLPSLPQLEQFIRINRHLPGLPSADSVSENGVALGEMQSRLLEKIEELTLYVLILNKANEELRGRIEMLER